MNWDADFAGLPPIDLTDGRSAEDAADGVKKGQQGLLAFLTETFRV